MTNLISIDFQTVYCNILCDFSKKNREGVSMPYIYLISFFLILTPLSRRRLQIIQTNMIFFTKIKVYDAKNRFTIGSGIKRRNIDSLRVRVKNKCPKQFGWLVNIASLQVVIFQNSPAESLFRVQYMGDCSHFWTYPNFQSAAKFS